MTKLALTIDEAVKAGVGGHTKIYQAINDGTLKAKKRGKRTIILVTEAARYLESLPDYPSQAAAT